MPAPRCIAWLPGVVLLASASACGGGCDSCSGVIPDAAIEDAAEDAAPAVDFEGVLSGHRKLAYRGDLDEVQRRQVIRVITRSNSTNYFLFRGQEFGFEYELAQLLAQELGVRLEVAVAPARRDLIPWLLAGRGDLVAAGLPTSTGRADRVAFSTPYMSVRNQVVVRRGRQPPLARPEDLLSEMVHVRRNSSYFKRLRTLGEQLGQSIPIAAAPESLETEDLIDMVGRGEIPVTIARSSFLAAELTWRDDIEAAFDLEGEEQIAWAMRREDGQLKRAVDAFFARHHRDVIFNTLYYKYFRNPKRAEILRDDGVRADRGGSLSPWDSQLRAAGRQHGLDWRLLAALMYQESRFEPRAQSWAGALGLMQLMPDTADKLGVADPFDPIQSIDGGARYLRQLIDSFGPELPLEERIRFALASYNVGRGHVDDARALASQLGHDPSRWFGHTEKAMLLLSRPRYYGGSQHGYCRGEEPVAYVSQIQTRYNAYVGVTPLEPDAGRAR